MSYTIAEKKQKLKEGEIIPLYYDDELVMRFYDRDVEFEKTQQGILSEVRRNPEKYAKQILEAEGYELGIEQGIEQGIETLVKNMKKMDFQ